MSYSDYLPPGTPSGNRHGETHFACQNEECGEYGIGVEVATVYERDTGAAYLEDENADICEVCGETMEETG
jgi:hypothetical protein